jgi:DNA topoisomerase-1
VLAAIALREFQKFDTKAQAKKNLIQAIESVALRLGNTTAVCRRCYIHPAVIDGYLDGATVAQIEKRAAEMLRHKLSGLTAEESAVLAFLEARLRASVASAVAAKTHKRLRAVRHLSKSARRARR